MTTSTDSMGYMLSSRELIFTILKDKVYSQLERKIKKSARAYSFIVKESQLLQHTGAEDQSY